jgi:hypothetical protein
MSRYKDYVFLTLSHIAPDYKLKDQKDKDKLRSGLRFNICIRQSTWEVIKDVDPYIQWINDNGSTTSGWDPLSNFTVENMSGRDEHIEVLVTVLQDNTMAFFNEIEEHCHYFNESDYTVVLLDILKEERLLYSRLKNGIRESETDTDEEKRIISKGQEAYLRDYPREQAALMAQELQEDKDYEERFQRELEEREKEKEEKRNLHKRKQEVLEKLKKNKKPATINQRINLSRTVSISPL